MYHDPTAISELTIFSGLIPVRDLVLDDGLNAYGSVFLGLILTDHLMQTFHPFIVLSTEV